MKVYYVNLLKKLPFLRKDLPANRILIKSSGCRINVDVTPPEIPATMCSYLTCEKRLFFPAGKTAPLAPLFFMDAIILSVCASVCVCRVLVGAVSSRPQRPSAPNLDFSG